MVRAGQYLTLRFCSCRSSIVPCHHEESKTRAINPFQASFDHRHDATQPSDPEHDYAMNEMIGNNVKLFISHTEHGAGCDSCDAWGDRVRAELAPSSYVPDLAIELTGSSWTVVDNPGTEYAPATPE